MPSRATLALGGAALGALALLTTYLGVVHVDPLAALDANVLGGFTDLQNTRAEQLAELAIRLANPLPFALACCALVAIALLRGRWRSALAVAVVLLGANVMTQLLKPGLTHPQITDALGGVPTHAGGFPSGHATAAMSLALCLVIVTPARLRGVAAALGGAYAVAVGYGLVLLDAHYPSDVLGGYLMAGVWALLGVAALLATDRRETAAAHPPARRRPERPRALERRIETFGPIALVAGGALVLAVAVALVRLPAVLDLATEHGAFVPGALGLAALALALAGGLAVALRR